MRGASPSLASTTVLMLILGCAGLPVEPPVKPVELQPKPIALTDVPPELSCLSDTLAREPGRLEDAHDIAVMTHGLSKTPKAEILAIACDPSTDRFKLGYVVYAYAMETSRDDMEAGAALLEWDAVQLGSPQAAVKLAALLVSGGPDGKPPADPVKASGFVGAGNFIGSRIAEKAGRGKAVDAIAINVMRTDGLRGHRKMLGEKKAEILAYQARVVDAFERQVVPLDRSK